MAFRNAKGNLIQSWLSGVDYDSAPFDVSKDCLIDASNVLPATAVGAIAQRNGYASYSTSALPGPVQGLFSIIIGGVEYMLAQAGTGFFNALSAAWTAITGSCSFTNNYNNLTSFAVLENVLYFTNRLSDGLFSWNGTGNAVQIPSGQLYTVIPHGNSTGNGYVVNDILTVSGGTGGQLLVTGVDGSGKVTSVSIYVNGSGIYQYGSGYSVANSVATTGGTGVGALVDIQAIYTPSQGIALFSFNGSLWTVGDPNNPLLGYYSDNNSGPNANQANNFLLFDQGQGWTTTGGTPYGIGQALVFKDKSITLIQATGTTPACTKSVFCDGIGCVSHQSIVTIPGGAVMFWDIDDIYMVTGNTVESATLHPITGKPRLKNFFRNKVEPSRLKYVVGCYYQSLGIVRWWYSPKGKTINTAHLDYHIATESFWPGTTTGNACCQRIIAGQSYLYSGDTNGYAYRQDYLTSDNGGAITANAQIPWQSFEGILVRKKGILFEAVTAIQGNYGLEVDFYFDQSQTPNLPNQQLSFQTLTGPTWDGTGVWDTSLWPTEGQLFDSSCPINRMFKTFSANIHNSGIDTPWAVYAVNVLERPLQVTAGT